MLSFELDGDEAVLRRFLSALELFTLAESLGGVESLISHAATMTHAGMAAEARAAAGISESLLRISVGIEDSEDLIADLERASVRRQRGKHECNCCSRAGERASTAQVWRQQSGGCEVLSACGRDYGGIQPAGRHDGGIGRRQYHQPVDQLAEAQPERSPVCAPCSRRCVVITAILSAACCRRKAPSR